MPWAPRGELRGLLWVPSPLPHAAVTTDAAPRSLARLALAPLASTPASAPVGLGPVLVPLTIGLRAPAVAQLRRPRRRPE